MPCLVPLSRILNLANPIECPPWDCGILLGKGDVLDALASGEVLSEPVADAHKGNPFHHACRIAWLVQHGWDDPIEVDVGVPHMGCYPEWPILDGNHRVYAAAVRGDKEILVTVAGDLGYAAQRFGIKARLLEEQAA